LMFRDEPPTLAHATVVCGCGGGDAVRQTLPRLLSSALRLVLDADALNAVATDASLQTLLQARAGRGLASVLTPHPLEAARLLGMHTAEVQADRLASAQQLALRYQCSVVLKGSGTVVASAGQVPSINPTGNAALASAGTGDVLAGWLGGLWSQQAGTDTGADAAHQAAIAAVWMHGAAAECVANGPMRAADLIERMHLLMQTRTKGQPAPR
jgi:ADP-dependent NAD(P)H-hydrate dehydratase / NAD(P)H-hydrate epimerase